MEYRGEYVPLGNTGIRVSRLAFGCGFRGIYDRKEAEDTISQAIEMGINYIDCANIYKLRSNIHAEEALGRALQGKRHEVVITSKFGAQINEKSPRPNGRGASRLHMIHAAEESLRRLRTDYIDVYLLHMPDEDTAFEETMRAFDQLLRDGKIRYAGLCNHKAWQVVAMQELQKRYGGCPISVIQNPYNLLNRSAEEELFPAIAYEGIGFMGYSPLGAGLLGGAFAGGQTPPEKSTWSYDPVYAKYRKHLFSGRAAQIVDRTGAMAEKYGVSSAAIATAWILKNPHVTCVLTGADTIEELKDSMTAVTLQLEAEDFACLNQISTGMQEEFAHPEVQKKLAALEALTKKEGLESNVI